MASRPSRLRRSCRDAVRGEGRTDLRIWARRVILSQFGGPAARHPHRCRAPDTAVILPLTWNGLIVPPSPRPGTGPNPPCAPAGRAVTAEVDTAGAVLLSYCEVRHRAGPPGCPRQAMA